uniref:Pericentriolar material 1 n=1 Tax=Xenopus tropicalis TaxID=8364 RepID=A0A6I8T1H3_XENTR
MATGGGPPDEALSDQDLPNWSHESLDDRLNNMDWKGQKKANRSTEKNKKKFVECDLRLTNDISPESSPGVGRRRARTPHTFPHTRYVSQMSVPEQAELEKLKQKINFSDLDQRSIGSDSQGRATAANNKRQLADNRKPFNFLPLQLNTNKEKSSKSPPKRESSTISSTKDFLASAFNKDFLSNSQAFLEEESQREPAIDSSQVVSRLVQIRDYITKASSLRDDLVEKNDLSANIDRLSNLIEHLKFQEKSYLKFLQKMLASENEEDDVRTVDSAMGSGSVAESTSLNIDVPSEASDTTGVDPQQEAKEELKNMKKQHALLTRMLQQQEQLRALKGRQAALLALQHKAEQTIAKMDESVVTETTGSVSGLSLASELNEELNDLIQRFHNQLHDSEDPPVPDNRRQAESLSLAREVYRSRNSSSSDTPLEDKSPLFNKVGVLLEKKQKMDTLLGELHTLHDQHLNNTAFMVSSVSPRRSTDQRTLGCAISAALSSDNRAANSPITVGTYQAASVNESEDEENQNPAEKLKKLKEVRKRLNELRELVHYYEQTSDMVTDAMNENTKDEDETEDSEYESEQEDDEPATNIRNPQYRSGWAQMNINSNAQSGTNNRDERQLNTECEINNRSAVNLRSINMSSALDCLYNIEHSDKEEDGNGEPDDEDAEDQGSRASLSSQNSVADDVQNVDFEQKFNRLVAAKQKLKQLQDLVAMYGDDSESEPVAPERSFSGDQLPPETTTLKQQPNNTRPNASKAKDIALKEQAREKFYESKLQQQQRELRQLQEERKKLIEIQEKIQTLRKACPDLQLSTSSAGTNPRNRQNRQMTTTTSTPEVTTNSKNVVPAMPDPEDSSSIDNEVWSEIRKHQILREDLRQRRKQLETLMAEHQRRQGQTDTSGASVRSDDSDTQGFQQQTRTEKTTATWGGSTQCALDEDDDDNEDDDDDDEGCLSDVHQIDIEDDEQGNTSCENSSYHQNSIRKTMLNGRSSKNGWKNQRPFSVEGNHRPSPKTRQQQNVSMRRQENYRWMSELSHVEEKEHWQGQIDQIKKQLDYSTNICQTLMRDQQTLSYLLQSMITSPYSVLPSNVGAPQVQLIMHQLNQCYTQLNWQQSNVLRLKQMLNDLLAQQQQHLQGESQQREDRGSSAPPPLTSPNIFTNFGFLPPTMNLLNMPFGSIPSVVPGVNFNPGFPHGFENFAQNVTSHADTPLQPHDQNTSGKTEYMAFPKPFESHTSNSTEKERNEPKKPDEGEQGRRIWVENHQKNDQEKKAGCFGAGISEGSGTSAKLAEESWKGKQFDEVSVESLSSMPDPVDPTTVTKMFKSRKASAQASLASKDKTPKAKNKKRKIFHQKSKGIKSIGASGFNVSEPNQTGCRHAQTEGATVGKVTTTSSAQRTEKESKATELSSEAGSDVSMFETLRDTIYSEVATLISQNESRPHFLIELFHELQLLNTDHLRQKALFALQDIVTRRITESNVKKHETCTKPLESAGWMASNSELTPSESLVTTDDELYAKNSDGPACQEIEQNDADNISSLSTSSNFEPFATDDLGNTVIHFDQALARMREYERMKNETEDSLVADCCNHLNAAASSLEGTNDESRGHAQHSADDASAIPCPYIDSKQLDRQIKAIMKEVIPFLKEHMEEVCSPNLLTSIRRLVLTLTQQNDESKEFVKFFHKQLGSILQDSLAKFSNKKLKDCGEDLLVEISEVLFNELAFFRLMQDLDNNSAAVQGKVSKKPDAAVVLESFTKEGDKDKDDTEAAQESRNIDAEVLSGKSDISEEDDVNENLPVSISLSKAETQALTNYGSGEDENEEEENYEFEARPVDVQTSLETSSEIADETEKEEMESRPEADIETEKTLSLAVHEMGELSIHEDQLKSDSDVLPHSSLLLSNGNTTDFSGTAPVNVKSPVDSPGTSGAGSSDTESPVLVNDFETGSGNLSQKSDEDDFVKVEDLPLKLTMPMPKEQIMKEMEEEEKKNNLCDEILNTSDEGNGADQLAGDPGALKEPVPDSPGINSA